MIGQDGIRNELNKVVRFYYDSKEDYRLACTRATDPAIRAEMDKECKVRERYHHELQEAETMLGVDMSDNGHVGADFKRDWERVRGAIAGNGLEAAMQLARASDRHAIEQIEALLTVHLTRSLADVLRAHLPHLRDSVARLEAHLGKKQPQVV